MRKIDYKYVGRMLVWALLLAMLLGMCGICSSIVPL